MGACCTKTDTVTVSSSEGGPENGTGSSNSAVPLVTKASAQAQGSVSQRCETASKTGVLTLSGMKLKELPAKHIGNLTGLRRLEATDNRLALLPPQLAAMSQLRAVSLANNAITDFTPLLGLQSLETLDLSGNRLVAIPPEFERYSRIKQLNFSGNLITAIADEAFAGLRETLLVLDLSGNRLTQLPQSLFTLHSLQELNVQTNQLRQFGNETTVRGLRSLRRLQIGNNRLTELPDALFGVTPLNQLEMDGNPLTPNNLRDLPSYAAWRHRQAQEINKQMQGGIVVRLNS
eukprot:TRINITY_DN617_c3_g1_i1.p1 TRINITY_DN617_c3_g1~~TRINITY_DN617_c3_g1_i1.p1  ORF type:complete len:290 (-),score=50.54 TRINITY_DN617_c3_g1_i1:482-1351(-)